MKVLTSTQYVDVPDDVTVSVKARKVTVTGPRGSLTQSFKHLKVDIRLIDGGRKIQIDLWFGKRKDVACVKTCCSHLTNMITGVTKGFGKSIFYGL